MKLSYKDVILLIGIMVAVAVAFTAWRYHDQNKANMAQPQIKKETLHSATSMVIGKLIKRVQSNVCVK